MKNIEAIDPLLPLINDEEITEILINSETDIFYEKNGKFKNMIYVLLIFKIIDCFYKNFVKKLKYNMT